MMNVRIKNFQSIGDMSLDITGFTVVVGRNNIGKSAIIRAVDAALNNRPGGEFIRQGKLKTEVDVKKDDLSITWTKGEKAVYKVNGQSYSGLNRSVPPPLLQAGFRKIETDEKKLDVLVAHQFNELFLLNESGSFITEVLSSLYDLNVLNDADDLCQKELRGNKTLLKTREADFEILRDKISLFSGFETVKKDWDGIKKLNEEIEAVSSEISVLDGYLSGITDLSTSIRNLEQIKNINIPDVEKSSRICDDYQWLEEACEILQRTLTGLTRLQPAESVRIPDMQNLTDRLQEMSDVERFYQELRTTVQMIEKFNSLSSCTSEIQKLDEKISGLEAGITEFSYVTDIHRILTDQAASVRSIISDHGTAQTSLHQLEEEYRKFKICPACERPL
jgi:DNA repair ATPase RecN